jgi:hypothetical protein
VDGPTPSKSYAIFSNPYLSYTQTPTPTHTHTHTHGTLSISKRVLIPSPVSRSRSPSPKPQNNWQSRAPHASTHNGHDATVPLTRSTAAVAQTLSLLLSIHVSPTRPRPFTNIIPRAHTACHARSDSLPSRRTGNGGPPDLRSRADFHKQQHVNLSVSNSALRRLNREAF